jgi:hypothetical protein
MDRKPLDPRLKITVVRVGTPTSSVATGPYHGDHARFRIQPWRPNPTTVTIMK